MKFTSAAFVATLALSSGAQAASVMKEFSWTGDGGYSFEGTFTYDDSFATVFASGLGPTNGLEELSVSFFDPTDTLLASFDNVTAGTSTYRFLEFSFDTSTMSLTPGSAFDVGEDMDNPGDIYILATEGSLGTLFAIGSSGVSSTPDSANPFLLTISDPDGASDPGSDPPADPGSNVIPLPASAFFVLGGLGALGALRRVRKAS